MHDPCWAEINVFLDGRKSWQSCFSLSIQRKQVRNIYKISRYKISVINSTSFCKSNKKLFLKTFWSPWNSTRTRSKTTQLFESDLKALCVWSTTTIAAVFTHFVQKAYQRKSQNYKAYLIQICAKYMENLCHGCQTHFTSCATYSPTGSQASHTSEKHFFSIISVKEQEYILKMFTFGHFNEICIYRNMITRLRCLEKNKCIYKKMSHVWMLYVYATQHWVSLLSLNRDHK